MSSVMWCLLGSTTGYLPSNFTLAFCNRPPILSNHSVNTELRFFNRKPLVLSCIIFSVSSPMENVLAAMNMSRPSRIVEFLPHLSPRRSVTPSHLPLIIIIQHMHPVHRSEQTGSVGNATESVQQKVEIHRWLVLNTCFSSILLYGSCDQIEFLKIFSLIVIVQFANNLPIQFKDSAVERSNYRFKHCQFLNSHLDPLSTYGMSNGRIDNALRSSYLLVTTVQPLCANRKSFGRVVVWRVPIPSESDLQSQAGRPNAEKSDSPLTLLPLTDAALPPGELPACLAVHSGRSRALVGVGTMEGRVEVYLWVSCFSHSLNLWLKLLWRFLVHACKWVQLNENAR